MKERRAHLAGEPLCRHCDVEGVIRAAERVDHIVPLEMDGAEDPTNKQSLCIPHHDAKTKDDKVAIARWKAARGRR